jgi:hypothetical protein
MEAVRRRRIIDRNSAVSRPQAAPLPRRERACDNFAKTAANTSRMGRASRSCTRPPRLFCVCDSNWNAGMGRRISAFFAAANELEA